MHASPSRFRYNCLISRLRGSQEKQSLVRDDFLTKNKCSCCASFMAFGAELKRGPLRLVWRQLNTAPDSAWLAQDPKLAQKTTRALRIFVLSTA